MDEPIRVEERPRDRLAECYLIMQTVGLSDPLALPVAEFDGILRMCASGEMVRSRDGDPCRAWVEAAMNGG